MISEPQVASTMLPLFSALFPADQPAQWRLPANTMAAVSSYLEAEFCHWRAEERLRLLQWVVLHKLIADTRRHAASRQTAGESPDALEQYMSPSGGGRESFAVLHKLLELDPRSLQQQLRQLQQQVQANKQAMLRAVQEVQESRAKLAGMRAEAATAAGGGLSLEDFEDVLLGSEVIPESPHLDGSQCLEDLEPCRLRGGAGGSSLDGSSSSSSTGGTVGDSQLGSPHNSSSWAAAGSAAQLQQEMAASTVELAGEDPGALEDM